MLKRLLMALPYVILGVIASTQVAHADFDPSRDELAIGTFFVALGLMVFFTIAYAIASFLGINKPGDVEIPDHAHDHRYAHQHHDH
jgi:hypothetical protein